MRALQIGAVEGSILSAAVFVAVCVGVLCIRVCLWDASLTSLLTESANRIAAALSIVLGWMSWVSGLRWPGRRKPWAQEWLEEAAAYPFPICKEIVILISSLPFSYCLVHLY